MSNSIFLHHLDAEIIVIVVKIAHRREVYNFIKEELKNYGSFKTLQRTFTDHARNT